MLNGKERLRYSRHLALPEFTEFDQLTLKNSKVLVIGAGGIGSPLILYLVAAGIGTIGIVEFDKVHLSNLQRQILFNENDIGKLKTDVIKNRLIKINGNVKFDIYNERFNEELADIIIPKYDIVVGATDNSESRFIIDDYCKKHQKVFINGSLKDYECQIAVFTYINGITYREIFGNSDNETGREENGVFGPLAGVAGCIMAAEVIKILLNKGNTLKNKLLRFDMFKMNWEVFNLGI